MLADALAAALACPRGATVWAGSAAEQGYWPRYETWYDDTYDMEEDSADATEHGMGSRRSDEATDDGLALEWSQCPHCYYWHVEGSPPCPWCLPRDLEITPEVGEASSTLATSAADGPRVAATSRDEGTTGGPALARTRLEVTLAVRDALAQRARDRALEVEAAHKGVLDANNRVTALQESIRSSGKRAKTHGDASPSEPRKEQGAAGEPAAAAAGDAASVHSLDSYVDEGAAPREPQRGTSSRLVAGQARAARAFGFGSGRCRK